MGSPIPCGIAGGAADAPVWDSGSIACGLGMGAVGTTGHPGARGAAIGAACSGPWRTAVWAAVAVSSAWRCRMLRPSMSTSACWTAAGVVCGSWAAEGMPMGSPVPCGAVDSRCPVVGRLGAGAAANGAGGGELWRAGGWTAAAGGPACRCRVLRPTMSSSACGGWGGVIGCGRSMSMSSCCRSRSGVVARARVAPAGISGRPCCSRRVASARMRERRV